MLRKNEAQERAASLLELQSRESDLAAQWQAIRDEATHWQKEAEAAQNEAAGMSMSLADLEAELNTAKAEVARYQAALEAAVRAAKEGGNDDELAESQSRVEALTDEITMLRKNAARERAALEAAVRKEAAAKAAENESELAKWKEQAHAAEGLLETRQQELVTLRHQSAWQKATLEVAVKAAKQETAKLAAGTGYDESKQLVVQMQAKSRPGCRCGLPGSPCGRGRR